MSVSAGVPEPPAPFAAEVDEVAVGTHLYRVHSVHRRSTEFNPGIGAATRFAFFGEPPEPVLYAAASEQAAVAETLLHDVPVSGGLLPYERYASAVMSRITLVRPLRMAVLHGLGLRRLRAAPDQVTASPASTYAATVRWAQAAFDAGFDGLVRMSSKCNDTKAYVFFGSRCDGAIEQDPSFGRIFATGEDQMWLIDLCAPCMWTCWWGRSSAK